jgi:glucose-1-phosphate cytidylyltransferase
MKVIILAGGLGTRISEETADKPKPMVEIAGKPMLWHIMNVFAKQGILDFIIATGYKGDVIREWVKLIQEPWNVTPLDTGLETNTGGRISECLAYLNGQSAYATYGDGLANVDIHKLQTFHRQQGRSATVTAVRPPARFGVLESDNGLVTHFGEKVQADAGWINGGFFVLESSVQREILANTDSFEADVMPRLVKNQQLSAYHHSEFWQPMDTLRERNLLSLYAAEDPPPWLRIS